MQSFSKKRHRLTNHRHSTPAAETSHKLRRSTSSTITTTTTTTATSTLTFNDASTADVILRLCFDAASPSSDDSSNQNDDVKADDASLYLHSEILARAKYFSALLSDRWHQNSNSNLISIKLTVPRNSLDNHITMFNLLYSLDFTAVITSVSTALDLLPIASQFLFEDCVKHSVNFLEAVPWTEEEENGVINVIPFLNKEESDLLLARVRVRVSDEELIGNDDSCEDMLHNLIISAMHCHPSSAYVKAFVAKLLRDFSSRESARIGLERAFEDSLRVVKESLEEYASPDFRSGTGDYNEMEAIQRISLHTALTNGKHLLWLVERMIELRVADNAVVEWSEQSGFTSDLQRAFQDDAWRNIVPGLPAVVLRCTAKLANAVATGAILAARQVRMKLVKDWLPVLIVCKDHVSPMLPSQKSLYLELEETFLKIISTLPMSDAQELLRQCLSFSTRNVEDCPHLVTAFNTWFRRAMRPPPGDPL